MNKSIFSLLLPALVGGAFWATPKVYAQATPGASPISLNVTNVPVSTALRTLFKAGGIQNFIIDADVQGTVNVTLADMPFSQALHQVLSAARLPLVADLQGDVYHVRIESPPSPNFDLIAAGAPATDPGPSQFYKVGIKHYDAGVIADLMTRKDGIILVPPNFVIPANSGAPSALTSPSVMTVPGATGGFGQSSSPFGQSSSPFGGAVLTRLGLATGPVAPPTAANVLPEGVKRIFALESDNSLVIEATSEGLTRLSP